MNNCNCNILHNHKNSKIGKSFNFSIWDRFSAYENNEEKQDFVEYEKNLYACIKSVGMDDINPKIDTNDGQRTGKYWVRVVSGIKGEDGDVFVPSISEDGILSWKRNSNIDPKPVNIMGSRGYGLEFKWDGSILYIKREDESSWVASPDLKSTKVYEPVLNGNNLTWEIKDKEAINIIDFGRIIGKSAYEVAVSQGFTGSESEWLESLKGDPGANLSIRVKDNWLQWKYDYEEISEYRNLYNIGDLLNNLSFDDAEEIKEEDKSYYVAHLRNGDENIATIKIPIQNFNENNFVKKEDFTIFANNIEKNINELTSTITWLEV